MATFIDGELKLSPELELKRIISLQEAEKVSSLSDRQPQAQSPRQNHRSGSASSRHASGRRADAARVS